MRFPKHLLIFFLLSPLYSKEITLKGKIQEAEVGSFIVTEQNKVFSFLHIFDKGDGKLFLEEVTIPVSAFACQKKGWKEWFETGALDNTSWMISEVDLETGCFEENFSFTHHGWVNFSKENNFLTTLLNLSFQEVPYTERRKVGLPPSYRVEDKRPLWQPRLVAHGMWQKNVSFTAWKARWPADGSDLAGKIIEIYLPEEASEAYPTYFPYWLEVEGKIGSARVRVVDAGFKARSPKTHMPRKSSYLQSCQQPL